MLHRRHLLLSLMLLPLAGCARASRRAEVHLGSGPVLDAPPTGLFARLSDELVRACAQDATNLVISPLSIGLVLAMVRGGATGATAAEIDAVLDVDADLPAAANTVWRALEADEGLGLTGAHQVWAEETLAWKQGYVDHLAAFGAPLRTEAIGARPDQVTADINRWVADATDDLITDLVKPGMIDSLTRMVLVNALHAKGAWQDPLTPQDPHPFTTSTGERRAVPWLTGGSLGRWVEDGRATGALLPLKESEAVLVLLRPSDPDLLPSTGPAASGTDRDHVVTRAAVDAVLDGEQAWVTLGMPRWSVRSDLELTDALRRVGVRTPFDPDRADFSGMTDGERLHVGFLVHQAVMDVDEHGFEAAAATAGGMAAGSYPVVARTLTLDRPFGFALVHAPTRTILFAGHVGDPSA